MDVAEALWFALAMVAPALVIGVALMAPRAFGAGSRWRRRRWGERHFMPRHPPIEQMAADLRRLLRRHESIRHSTEVAMRARHLRAVEAAIGDCAIQAASALGVPSPPRPIHGALPVPELRRLLQALTGAGLVLVPATGLLVVDPAD